MTSSLALLMAPECTILSKWPCLLRVTEGSDQNWVNPIPLQLLNWDVDETAVESWAKWSQRIWAKGCTNPGKSPMQTGIMKKDHQWASLCVQQRLGKTCREKQRWKPRERGTSGEREREHSLRFSRFASLLRGCLWFILISPCFHNNPLFWHDKMWVVSIADNTRILTPDQKNNLMVNYFRLRVL